MLVAQHNIDLIDKESVSIINIWIKLLTAIFYETIIKKHYAKQP